MHITNRLFTFSLTGSVPSQYSENVVLRCYEWWLWQESQDVVQNMAETVS